MSDAPGAGGNLRTGFIAGVLNGLIGIGGGIIIVPALVRRGYTPQQAVGTSLATVVVLSAIGFLVHVAATGITLGAQAFLVVLVGGLAGSVAGGWILARLSPRGLLIVFSVLIFTVALRLVLQGLGIASMHPLWPGEPSLLAYLLVGVSSGVLSGMLGVGGGAMVMLGLTVLFGLPVQEGLPVALAINVSNALSGAVTHSLAGRVRRGDVTALIPAAVVGIGAGAALALWLPEDTLRVVLGLFFCVMGVRVARQALSRPR